MDSQSTYIRSRLSVKPSDPNYDRLLLAHIRARITVDPTIGCWLWQGPVAEVKWNARGFRTGGYGYISYRGRNIGIHRAMWMLSNGPQPAKMDVCHTCDVRHCCNPDHLWLGTRKQNLQDMADKHRGPCGEKAAKTVCDRGHPLSGDNLTLSNGGRRRGCRACDKILRATPKYVEWRRAYQRMRRGWTKDEAYGISPIPAGQRSERRSIGVRK